MVIELDISHHHASIEDCTSFTIEKMNAKYFFDDVQAFYGLAYDYQIFSSYLLIGRITLYQRPLYIAISHSPEELMIYADMHSIPIESNSFIKLEPNHEKEQ